MFKKYLYDSHYNVILEYNPEYRGIYEFVAYKVRDSLPAVMKSGWFQTPIEYITKQGDTIEEVIDGYVVVRKNLTPLIFENKDQVRLNRGQYGYSNSVVYGAMFTDKGIFYVAKMKDDGGLELL